MTCFGEFLKVKELGSRDMTCLLLVGQPTGRVVQEASASVPVATLFAEQLQHSGWSVIHLNV